MLKLSSWELKEMWMNLRKFLWKWRKSVQRKKKLRLVRKMSRERGDLVTPES